MQGNRVLVRSLERPPSTFWLLSRPLKTVSSLPFKTQPPSVLPPSFWFTNWRLYQGRRHVTHYWSAAAPHRSWVWQTLDTWNPKVSSTRASQYSISIDADARLPADSFRLSVVAGVEVSSQSASSSWWRFPRALIATFALPSHADLQVGRYQICSHCFPMGSRPSSVVFHPTYRNALSVGLSRFLPYLMENNLI